MFFSGLVLFYWGWCKGSIPLQVPAGTTDMLTVWPYGVFMVWYCHHVDGTTWYHGYVS